MQTSVRYKTLVIDAKNMVMRNYYAYPTSLHGGEGHATNLIHGSFLELFRHVAKFLPERVVLTWDSRSKFRRILWPGYKNTRKSTLNQGQFADLSKQIAVFQEGLGYLRCCELRVDDVEGDDLVALTAIQSDLQPCLVVSTDRDFWQLVRPTVSILNPVTKSLLATPGFAKLTGFDSPEHHLAFKCLKGDSGDGVPSALIRVGETKAKELAKKIKLPEAVQLSAVVADALLHPHRFSIDVPGYSDVAEQVARNFMLVSLHAAIFAQKELLAPVTFDVHTGDWSKFIEYCQRHALMLVGKAYGEVDNRL